MDARQKAAHALLMRRKGRDNFADFNRAVCPPGEEPVQHHLVICNAYDSLISGEVQRIMLNLPPGSAKSTYATVRGPAYWLGRMQGRRKGIITASNTASLAASFGRRVRNLVMSPEYQAIFPGVRLAADANAKGEWETSDGGFYFAAGVGSSIAGRRGDLGVIDDPVKTRKDADSSTTQLTNWEWYLGDFLSRLKPDTAQQLLIQTRWNENDISGKILPENWNGESGLIHCRDGNNWLVISIPAEAMSPNDPLGRPMEGDDRWLWPEFFSPQYWEDMKRTQLLVPRNWWSLYQQLPAAVEGNLFKRAKTKWYSERPKDLNLYITSDMAVSDQDDADFTEIGVWGVDSQGDIYALDWWHGRQESDVWIEQICDMVERHKPLYFAGETGVIKRAVEPYLRKRILERRLSVSVEWLSHSENTKVEDATSFLALYNAGRVHWPEGSAWADRVLNQLYKFPAGAKDDAVDTCSLLGRLLDKVWSPAKKPEPKPVKVIEAAPLTWGDLMS